MTPMAEWWEGRNMCKVIAADLGSERWCLDERKFLLVVSSDLTARERIDAARAAFAVAGQDQPGDGVTCVCGLEPDMPGEARGRPRPAPAALTAVAAVVWFVVHTLMSVQGIW
jgi:hypothetical protein